MGRAAAFACLVLALAAPSAPAQFEPKIVGGSARNSTSQSLIVKLKR